MADHKKWFKVWTTILLDPHHMNMSLKDVGRWTRLGALMVSQGDNGKLVLYPPAKAFIASMECDTFEASISALKVLPNVHIEEGKNDNGETTVSFSNWFKYQMDSTGYERVKRSRYKRREEKSRKEKRILFAQPTLSELEEYGKEIQYPLDAQLFLNYYAARGWQYKQGQPMKDWKAAVRTWKKNNFTNDSSSKESPSWM